MNPLILFNIGGTIFTIQAIRYYSLTFYRHETLLFNWFTFFFFGSLFPMSFKGLI
ncbi:hypothetical protein GGI43DRAFT_410697 [Trichoderma evansii]